MASFELFTLTILQLRLQAFGWHIDWLARTAVSLILARYA